MTAFDHGSSRKRKLIAWLWPSFVCAGFFSSVLFAFVDPVVIARELGFDDGHRLSGYSVTFLFCWALGTASVVFALSLISRPNQQAAAAHNEHRE